MEDQSDGFNFSEYITNISFKNKFYFILIFMATWIMFLTATTYFLRLEWLQLLNHRYKATFYQEPLTGLVNNLAIYKIALNSTNTDEYDFKLNTLAIDEQIAALTQEISSTPSWMRNETVVLIQKIIDGWSLIKGEEVIKDEKRIILNNMLVNCLKAIDQINISSSLIITDNFAMLRISRLLNVKIPLITNTLTMISQELNSPDFDRLAIGVTIADQMNEINETLVNSHVDRRVFALVDEKEPIKEEGISLVKEFDSLVRGLEEFSENLNTAISDRLAGNRIDMTGDIVSLIKANDRFDSLVYPLVANQYRMLRNSEYMVIISIILINIFLIILVLIVWPSGSMQRPLNELIAGTQALIEGRYDVRVESRGTNEIGEISTIFNTIAESLESAFSTVASASEIFVKESAAINQNIGELRQHVILRTDNFKEITARLKMVLSEVLTITGILDQINASIKITTAHSNKGEILLEDTATSLSRMEQKAKEVLLNLYEFENRVAETNKIIDTIIKIVDQANLLYLNASIHANRSGESGRGFSIISGKIHELANISAYFTLDIEKTINGLIPQLNYVSKLIEEFSRDVKGQEQDTKQIKSQVHLFISITKKQIDLYNSLIDETNRQAGLMNTVNQFAANQSKRALDIRNDLLNLQKGVALITHSAENFKLYSKTGK